MSQTETNTGLSAHDLTIGYPAKGAPIVLAKQLSLELRPAQFTCLLGPNGAGKTTLLRTLSGSLPPLAGSIHLQGQQLTDISPRERARRLSIVRTGATPPGRMDARAYVALGRHPYSGWLGRLNAKDHATIEWALDAVGATHLTNHPVNELSDGERQKITIARALAQEAGVLLLDEPTAHLDLPNRIEIMTRLRRLSREKNLAVLLSTHDLDLALEHADQLWLLQTDGSLREGEPKALARSGAIAETFAHQSLRWDALRSRFTQTPPDEQSGQVPE